MSERNCTSGAEMKRPCQAGEPDLATHHVMQEASADGGSDSSSITRFPSLGGSTVQHSCSPVTRQAFCSSGTNTQFMSFLTCQAKGPLFPWCRELVAGASEQWRDSNSPWKDRPGRCGSFWSHGSQMTLGRSSCLQVCIQIKRQESTGPFTESVSVLGETLEISRFQLSSCCLLQGLWAQRLRSSPVIYLAKAPDFQTESSSPPNHHLSPQGLMDRQQIFPSPYILRVATGERERRPLSHPLRAENQQSPIRRDL